MRERAPTLLLSGFIVFVVFLSLLFLVAPKNEASMVTRAIVFMVLIVPPVCFGAGIFSSFVRPAGPWRHGVLVNAAAILVHGIVSILVLQSFFA